MGGVSVQVFYALTDDLNTPLAISELHKEADKDFSALLDSAQLLGILNHTPEEWFHGQDDTSWIDEQISLRNKARSDNDYETSDKIRERLKEKGIILEDSPNGTTWRKE